MDSIAARHHIILRNQAGVVVALFDDYQSFSCTRTVNDVGSYDLLFVDNEEGRRDLFELDGQLELHRSVPALGLKDYVEFRGLHRKLNLSTTGDGTRIMTSTGVDYNELLARRAIAYNSGTIRSDKENVAETVMKEYVEENCGPTSENYTVVGRFVSGYMPNFTIETDTGGGPSWTGSRAGENLLDVLKDIAAISRVDFEVAHNGNASFLFKVYLDQLGSNRTAQTVYDVSGRNAYGNYPVTFSVGRGNVQSISYDYDRLSEGNVVIIYGDGDGSTQDEYVRESGAVADSPWNSREVVRSGGNQEFAYQYEAVGDEALMDLRAKRTFTLTPLQQPSSMYGIHYFLGDIVTVKYDDIVLDRRITSVTLVVRDDGKETITLSLENQGYD